MPPRVLTVGFGTFGGACLAGVHYWSYKPRRRLPAGRRVGNSLGGVGAHGFLKRFLAAGLH